MGSQEITDVTFFRIWQLALKTTTTPKLVPVTGETDAYKLTAVRPIEFVEPPKGIFDNHILVKSVLVHLIQLPVIYPLPNMDQLQSLFIPVITGVEIAGGHSLGLEGILIALMNRRLGHNYDFLPATFYHYLQA